MKKPNLDYQNIFYYLSGLAGLFYIVLLILLFTGFLPVFFADNLTYVFFGVIVVITTYLALRIKDIPEAQREKSTIVFYSKYFFILALVVIAINQFLKRQIIIDIMLEITIVTIALGFLTFYAHKNRVEKELEEEKTKEEQAEQKRKAEFDKKFPKIAKLNLSYGFENAKKIKEKPKRWLTYLFLVLVSPFIWLVRLPYNLVKWGYKEGWWYSGLILIIFIFGLVIRMINLSYLDPYTDEYLHLIAAKNLIQSGTLEYSRGLIVTLLTSFFIWVGNPENLKDFIFLGRIPSVIFSISTIFPLYLIAKRVSKKIGIITIFLWTISPWAIGVSKTIREYSYYPFFILIISFIAMKVFETTVESKKLITIKNIFYVSLIIFFMIYSLFLDNLSTLKIGVLIVFIIFIYRLFSNSKKVCLILKNKKIIAIVLTTLILLLLIFGLKTNKSQISSLNEIQFTSQWANYFLSSSGSPMQWWDKTNFEYVAYFIISFGMIYSFLTNEKNYFLNLIIFLGILIFFIYFFDRYIRPRYIFYAMPFFTILIASGIYAIIKLGERFSLNKRLIGLVLIIILLSFFNLANTFNAVYSNNHGYVRTTNEHHDYVYGTLNFLDGRITDKDIFITTVVGKAIQLEFDITPERIYEYSYQDEDRFKKVEEIVNKQERGYIILDYRRNGYWVEGYPREKTFFIGNTTIQTIRDEEGIQVYFWKK